MIIDLLVSALAVFVSAYIVPGVYVTIFGSVIAAIVIGVINMFIKPFVKLISLPITILSLGLFSLVINALFVILVGKLVPGFSVSGFWSALWFSILLSLITAFFNVIKNRNS